MTIRPFLSRAPSAGTVAFCRERFLISATVEQLLLVASVFWMLTANRAFFGAALKDRNGLSDPVGAASRIHVIQALSGG